MDSAVSEEESDKQETEPAVNEEQKKIITDLLQFLEQVHAENSDKSDEQAKATQNLLLKWSNNGEMSKELEDLLPSANKLGIEEDELFNADILTVQSLLQNLSNMAPEDLEEFGLKEAADIIAWSKMQSLLTQTNESSEDAKTLNLHTEQLLETIGEKFKNLLVTDQFNVNEEKQYQDLPILSAKQLHNENPQLTEKAEAFSLTLLNEGQPVTQEQFVKEFSAILRKGDLFGGDGSKRLLVHLNPEKLGSFSIEMLQKDGIMTARIMTATSQVKDLLEKQLPSLKQAFSFQNLQVDKINIESLNQGSFFVRNQGQRESGIQLQEKGGLQETFLSLVKEGQPVTQEQFVKEFSAILRKEDLFGGDGSKRLLVHLNPEKLGSFSIEMLQKDGIMSARIMTATSQVKDLLEKQLPSLKQAFSFQNLQVDKINIESLNQGSFFVRNQGQKESGIQLQEKGGLQETGSQGNFQTPMSKVEQFFLSPVKEGQPVTQEQFIKEFSAILKKANFSAINGVNKLLIRLNPENLGSLRVEMVQKDGLMTVKILATTAQAKDLLEKQLQSLKQALSIQNIQVDKIDISQQPGSLNQERLFHKEPEQQDRGNHSQDQSKQENESEETAGFSETLDDALLNLEV
ncbi:flagellar hook-length control protein FliK [Bacillus massiliglaciei]|uniref:flagellar hook-length control protein FliK n=1 Tax=Bacillus massiliglaciei TaxID=1816693 RepID=UPI0018FEE358|nr:flagellar hook-length control protein FliK [Bacillus massiliglaciei]